MMMSSGVVSECGLPLVEGGAHYTDYRFPNMVIMVCYIMNLQIKDKFSRLSFVRRFVSF